jgi:hypothetical protein
MPARSSRRIAGPAQPYETCCSDKGPYGPREKARICEFRDKLDAVEAAKQVNLKDYKIVRVEDWL